MLSDTQPTAYASNPLDNSEATLRSEVHFVQRSADSYHPTYSVAEPACTAETDPARTLQSGRSGLVEVGKPGDDCCSSTTRRGDGNSNLDGSIEQHCCNSACLRENLSAAVPNGQGSSTRGIEERDLVERFGIGNTSPLSAERTSSDSSGNSRAGGSSRDVAESPCREPGTDRIGTRDDGADECRPGEREPGCMGSCESDSGSGGQVREATDDRRSDRNNETLRRSETYRTHAYQAPLAAPSAITPSRIGDRPLTNCRKCLPTLTLSEREELGRLKPGASQRYAELRKRATVCCQTRLVVDYMDFTRAEARKVWRRSLPKTLVHRSYLGDYEDAEDVGLQALMRTAQSWPLPCHICRGARVMLNLLTGVREVCAECEGTGQPHNLHTAVHAYLRLAILTQVRNELNRRAAEAREQIQMGRELRQTGNFRAGRGVLRDARTIGTPTGGAGGTGSADELSTSLSDAGKPATGLRVKTGCSGAGVEGLDVSPLTGVVWLRPSEKLTREYPRRGLTAEQWESYAEAYRAELRRSIVRYRDEWAWLMNELEVTFVCGCRTADRCHRSVLASVLEGAGAVWEGEVGGLIPLRFGKSALASGL